MADRPVVNPQRAPVQPQVGARTRSYGGPLVQRDAQVEGLLQGLSNFNQGLTSYTGTQIDREAKMAIEAGEAAARTAPDGAPDARTFDVPFAFGEHFDAGYRSAINTKHALQAKQDFLDRFEEEYTKPDFDPKAFTESYWSEQVAGAQDTDYIAKMSEQRAITEAHARTAFRNLTIKRATEAEQEANSAMIRDTIQPDMTPEQIVAAYRDKVRPELQSRGFTRMTGAEQVALLFSHVQNLSIDGGGRPELFDAFDKFKDEKNGLTLADMNKDVSARIAAARKTAEDQREKRIHEEATGDRVVAIAAFEKDIDEGRGDYLTPELVATFYPALSEGQINSLLERRARHKTVTDDLAHARLLATPTQDSNGRLALVGNKDIEKKVIDEVLAPHVAALDAYLRGGTNPDGTPYTVEQASAAIKQAVVDYNKMGASVPPETLQNYFKSFTGTIPSTTAEPDKGFVAVASVWKTLPDNVKQLISDQKTYDLFEAYNWAEPTQGPKGAYLAAYSSIDPKKVEDARKALAADPELQRKLANDARTEITGWGIAKWIPGAKAFGWELPEDQANILTTAAMNEVERAQRANPTMSPEQRRNHAERYMRENFVAIDGVSGGIVVRVPPQQTSEPVQKALQSAYNDALEEAKVRARQHGLWGQEWSMYVSTDNPATGAISFRLMHNGTDQGWVKSTTVADEAKRYAAKTIPTDADKAAYGAVEVALKSGQPVTPEMVAAARPASAKMRAIKGSNPKVEEFLEKYDQSRFKQIFDQVVKLNLPPEATKTNRIADGTSRAEVGSTLGPIDRRQMRATTVSIATQFLRNAQVSPQNGVVGSANSRAASLAAALITMGEGAASHRYVDPADGAGDNIGAGYNLKSRAKVAEKDLRKAGVPDADIPLVIAGKRALTPHQIMGLLTHVLPEYMDLARNTLEKAAPGVWDKLPPNYQAVLTDVAYQTRDPSVFKNAYAALASGDYRAFSEHIKVHYKKNGVMVPDDRRNDLRMNLLADPVRFAALVRSGKL